MMGSILLLAAAAVAQPKLDAMSPVTGGTQFVFTIADPTKYTLAVRTASEGGKHVLVLTVTDDGTPGPGPVVPPTPSPGPTPAPEPKPVPQPTPQPTPSPAPADKFGMTEKVAKWAVEAKLPAAQCQAVAKNYRAIVSAIAAGAIKASDVKAEALKRNQEVLGESYADWTPFRDRVNKAVAELIAAKKFTGSKDDFQQLYSEFAAGLERVK